MAERKDPELRTVKPAGAPVPSGRPGKKPGIGDRFRRLAATRGWRTYGAGGCLLAAAVLVFCAGLVLDRVWDGRLEAHRTELQAAYDLAAADKAQAPGGQSGTDGPQAATDADADAASDADPLRRSGDDRVAADMLSHATTWDDRAEYEASRAELLSHYDWLTEDTNPEFLLKFFAPGDDLYLYIDGEVVGDLMSDGRNLSFGSMTSYLLEERPDKGRSYFAEVTVQSRGQVGGSADAHLVVTYDTDASNRVSGMKCYTV